MVIPGTSLLGEYAKARVLEECHLEKSPSLVTGRSPAPGLPSHYLPLFIVFAVILL